MIDEGINAADVRNVVTESKRPELRGHQGDLHLAEINGHRIFVKAATGNPLSAYIRCWMLRREYSVYQRLQGLPGIPRCFGFYDDRYLVIEAIEGRNLRYAVIEDREAFYRQLFEVIDGIHARGVTHGDLMRRDNIIVDEHESPVLVDFGVSIIYRPGLHPVNHLAYRFFLQHDLNAWLKHKYRRHRERMAPEDARYYRPLLMDDLARGFKVIWETLQAWRKPTLH